MTGHRAGIVKDREINGELIRAGHAWAFRKYMKKSGGSLLRLRGGCARGETRSLESARRGSSTALDLALGYHL